MLLRVLLAATALSFALAPPADDEADYVFAYLKSVPDAPKKSPTEALKMQTEHLAGIVKLSKQGSILLAGPFPVSPPDPAARGLIVYDVATVAEAEKLAATDAAVQAGQMVAEAWPMRASTALRRLPQLMREGLASRPAPPPGMPPFALRGYVLGLADDAAAADRGLASLRAQSKVIAFGRFGGSKAGRAMFVLDASDVDAANTMLAPHRAAMGAFTLHPWFSSDTVAKLVAPDDAASRKSGSGR